MLKNVYAQLELHFGLIRETTPKYTSYSYKQITATTNDRSSAAQAIRNTAKRASTLYHLDVDLAARSSGVPRGDIVTKLNNWHDGALIDLRTGGVINLYRVLQALPSTAADRHRIADQLYAELEPREMQDLERMQEVMDLINGSACYSRRLAEHFGDTLPGGAAECGSCTWCQTHNAINVIKPTPKPFDYALFRNVLDAVPERDDARYLARVAFGISSPRATQAKISKDAVFGSMEDFDFTVRSPHLHRLAASPPNANIGVVERVCQSV